MAISNKKLSEAIGNLEPEVPELRRGEGVKLSIEETIPTPGEARGASHPTKDNSPIRIKPGYTLRKDLIRECKRIALETDRKVYQVMEEALAEYIERYNTAEERKRER